MDFYSTIITLKRTKEESAFINLHVTDDLLETDKLGELKIDVRKLFARAKAIGEQMDLNWIPQGLPIVDVSHIQCRPNNEDLDWLADHVVGKPEAQAPAVSGADTLLRPSAKPLDKFQEPSQTSLNERIKNLGMCLSLTITPSFSSQREWVIHRKLPVGSREDYYAICTYLQMEDETGLNAHFSKTYDINDPNLVKYTKVLIQNVISLNTEYIEGFLARLSKMKLSIAIDFKPESMTLDGTCYVLLLKNHSQALEFKWSNKNPKEWQEMFGLVAELLEVLGDRYGE
jgi:hypothetical protein